MSLSDNYPDIRPLWMNDYANAGVIDPRCSFARSDSTPSNVHYWSSEDHLSSENLIAYSSDISNSYWTKQGVSPTGGQTAPDGGTDAYKLTENASTSDHRIYHLFGATPTDETTITFYVKYIGRQWIYVRAKDSGGTNRYCWFDIQNGLVGTVQTNVTASIASSGNGYYKCTVVLASAIASGQSLNIGGAAADGDGAGYAGLNGDAFALWGINMSTLGETTLNETSGQIHREYAATLKSVAYSGQPRFEYEPTGDRSAKGLLLEGQAQNLNTYSNDSTQWGSVNVNMTAASGVAPSGVLEANLCVPSAATDFHWFYVTAPNFTSGTAYTQSVYVKAAGANYIQLSYSGSAFPTVHCNFDLANGTVGSSSGMTGGIESVGNGWYRIFGTVTATSSSTAIPFISHITSSTSGRRPTTVGDGYSGYLVYGYQVEANSFPSSYIAASGSASTRTADSLSVATADIGYTGGPVSVVSETIGGQGSFPIAWVLKNSNASESLQFYKASGSATTSSNWRVYATVNGANTVATTINSSASAGKIAVSFDANDVAFTSSGNAVQTDTSTALLSGISTLSVGGSTNQEINGHVKRIALYSEALTDTELQALTS